MTHRLVVCVVLGAAACGGGTGRSGAGGGGSGFGGVPTLFAGLFVDGKAFRYTIKTETSHWDDTDPKADQDGNVHTVETAAMKLTCTVHGMQNFTHAVAIKLECDGTVDGEFSPAGVWVATAEGIWRRDTFPLDDGEVAKLPPGEMLLGATPVARNDTQDEAGGGAGAGAGAGGEGGAGGTAIIIEDKGGGRWCRTEATWGGDEAGKTLCFAVGKGLVGGGTYFAGGSTKDITFELGE